DSLSARGSRVHTPCGPRKSGMPDSVDIPAPVSAMTREASLIHPRTTSIVMDARSRIRRAVRGAPGRGDGPSRRCGTPQGIGGRRRRASLPDAQPHGLGEAFVMLIRAGRPVKPRGARRARAGFQPDRPAGARRRWHGGPVSGTLTPADGGPTMRIQLIVCSAALALAPLRLAAHHSFAAEFDAS